MARYEARKDVGLVNGKVLWLYDNKQKRFVDMDEVLNLLNAHDGMMTREQVENEIKNSFQHAVRLEGYKHALETVLKGGTK